MILGISPASGEGRWRYCKYCYKSVALAHRWELVEGQYYRQVLCAECEYGLEPVVEVDSSAVPLALWA